MYDDEIRRLSPLLVQGRVYYIWQILTRPINTNHEYILAEDSHIVCNFTSDTVVVELQKDNDNVIPLYPKFMTFDRICEIIDKGYKHVGEFTY